MHALYHFADVDLRTGDACDPMSCDGLAHAEPSVNRTTLLDWLGRGSSCRPARVRAFRNQPVLGVNTVRFVSLVVVTPICWGLLCAMSWVAALVGLKRRRSVGTGPAEGSVR